MKTNLVFIISIALLGFTQVAGAQANVSDKMYQYFKVKDEVTYMSFSKNMMDFVDLDLDDSGVTGDLNEVRMIIYKPEVRPDKCFQDQVLSYLKKGNYEQVEDEHEHDDHGDDTEVWVNRKGKKIFECHVIFQGEQNGVLLSFFGDFKVDDVEKLEKKIEDYK